MSQSNVLRLAARLTMLAILGLLWGLSAGDSEGAPKKSNDVVKVTAKADKPDADGKQTVIVTLTIDKPWHLYANPVGNDDLAGNETVISISAKEKLGDVKVEYPAGKVVKDSTGSYKIYEDKVEVKITLKRAKGDTSPLEVTAKVNACDANSCLPPGSVKVPVE